eukprot:TRINITY_DN27933_c1_g1_i1.p1 TRINITY_DN27933_c1_g1~~TRINITY_DN27933_c1_g1_i1.p1  ORF type:complete len:352 (+),score=36.46 TRINITY_DN27933_c1_g1_i1:40-1095(+)
MADVERAHDEKTPLVRSKSGRPSAIRVHGSIALAYAIIGGGAVVSKFAVTTVHPLTFELVREIISVVLLLSMSKGSGHRLTVEAEDLPMFILASSCLFCNQVCIFLGVQFTEALVVSLWGAALPIFVTTASVMCGFESLTDRLVIGGLIAIVGALIIPISSGGVASTDATRSQSVYMAGNFMLFTATCGCSGYILASGVLVRRYPALTVTGLCFMLSSVLVFITTAVVFCIPQALEIVCYGREDCIAHPWNFDTTAIPPLIYEVIMCTVVAWSLLTWSTQYAKPSVSSLYTVVQPVTASFISFVLYNTVSMDWLARYSFRQPDWTHLVASMIVILGLVVALSDDHGVWRDE